MESAPPVLPDLTDPKRLRPFVETIVETVPDIVAAISPLGIVLSLNAAFESATGWSKTEWIGRYFEGLIHPDDVQRVAGAIQEGMVKRNTIKLEMRIRRKNGEYFEVEVLGNPHYEGDHLQALIGIARDVTSRKQMELELNAYRKELEGAVRERTLEQLKTNRELKRSNHELEQFAYVVSHDIQEPLRAIATYSELLVKEYAARLDREALEYLRFMTEGVSRVQILIRDLLEYSRVSRKRASVEAVDCASVMRAVLESLDVVIKDTKAEIIVEDLPSIEGNVQQILRLFQNLITNALKFRLPDVPPRIRVFAKPSNASWLFGVSDNGIGIDKHHHERIFFLFQRLFTREEFPGSGVGLSICKRIVEQHEGRIWVESVEGQGATFYFSLPQSRNQDKPQAEIFPDRKIVLTNEI